MASTLLNSPSLGELVAAGWGVGDEDDADGGKDDREGGEGRAEWWRQIPVLLVTCSSCLLCVCVCARACGCVLCVYVCLALRSILMAGQSRAVVEISRTSRLHVMSR